MATPRQAIKKQNKTKQKQNNIGRHVSYICPVRIHGKKQPERATIFVTFLKYIHCLLGDMDNMLNYG